LIEEATLLTFFFIRLTATKGYFVRKLAILLMKVKCFFKGGLEHRMKTSLVKQRCRIQVSRLVTMSGKLKKLDEMAS
jgi:hypothetical protein